MAENESNNMVRIGKIAWGIAVVIPLAFLAVFFVWPVGSMLIRGFLAGSDPSSGFTVLASARTWRIIWQTLWMALAGTLGSVVLGIPGAYVLYRLRFRGQGAVRAFVMIPFVLPTVVVGIAFRALLDGPLAALHLSNTTIAVVLAMIFFNYSLVVRIVGTMWATLSPRQSDAARTLGASPSRTFFTITLPQLTPAIVAASSLVFLYCCTAYGLVTALGRPGSGTLETEIYIQTVTYFNLDKAAILSLIQCLIVVIVLIISSLVTKRAESVLAVNTLPGRAPNRSDACAVAVTAIVCVGLASPIVTLVLRSFRADGNWSLLNYRLLETPGEGFAGSVPVIESLVHSVLIAGDSTFIALIVGLLLAYVLSRRLVGVCERLQKIIDAFVLLPLGISTVTVGFGMLITLGMGPMARSAWLVPIAQAVVALPLVVSAIVPAARAISPRMKEAAATLGASPWRVLVTIEIPLLALRILVAGAFAFAISMGEFGATSFLANPDYQTLPVTIIKLLGRPGAHNFGMAMAGAVVLLVFTGGAMYVAEFFKYLADIASGCARKQK